MKNIFGNNLEYISSFGIWKIKGCSGINYSDGDKNENYILNVIQNASDISVNSQELENAIKNWPSEYHLSKKRSQLLKGFKFNESMENILEIGSGCGAITRYIGESLPAAHIIGVEGGMRRSQIARSRTRDLQNVDIICAPFNELEFLTKFDLVVCVGVLEYSSVFINSSTPFDDFLTSINNILNPNGVLIIAIENQFGLKYFAGCHEDHTGILFEGIEGYSKTRKNSGRTFGVHRLQSMLRQNNYKHIELYYPFPDYKLPDSIISNEAAKKATVNIGDLISIQQSRSYGAARSYLFDERLAWWEISKNNLMPEFANSFLLFASKSDKQSYVTSTWDAISFASLNRKKQYQTKTLFNVITKNPSVKKELLNDMDRDINSDQKIIHKVHKCKWITGVPLLIEISKDIHNCNKEGYILGESVKKWLKYLQYNSIDKKQEMIGGYYIDAIPRNLITTSNDALEFIDDEWQWSKPLPIKIIILRGLFYLLKDNQIKRRLTHLNKRSLMQLMIHVCIGYMGKCSKKDITEFVEFESNLQCIISGKPHCVIKDEIINELNRQSQNSQKNNYLKRALRKIVKAIIK